MSSRGTGPILIKPRNYYAVVEGGTDKTGQGRVSRVGFTEDIFS